MADIKGKARQTSSVTRGSEGAESYMRMLRDGTVGVADLIALWSLEGRVFTISAGAATSPATFAAGALNTGEFDLHIEVPGSVVIIPLLWDITFDAYGATGIVECCLQYGTGSVVGTATADTPTSSNANAGIASVCTCNHSSGTGTALTTVVEEIWHDGLQAGITRLSGGSVVSPYKFKFSAKADGVLHVIGPSQQLVGFTAANVGTGFFQFKYAELPAESIK